MYGVEESLWISVSEHYLEGPAARWFQSIESQIRTASWSTFCQLLHDRFDHDQHELFIRKVFSIKQLTTVSDYVTRFTALVDQLAAYSNSTHPVYYTMRFIDGLFPDIKAVVLVQRPQNLDATCVLALLQEEAGAATQTKQPRSGDWYASSKFQHTPRTPLPLPPPPRTDKGPASAPASAVAAPAVKHSSSADPKLHAVKAYWKALGLCYKCGAKWSKDHTCPPEVLLAVEALWDSFDNSEDGCSDP
jgi:hypothetical protein